MYIVDVVVTFWSLTQEVAGLKLLGHMINLYQKLDWKKQARGRGMISEHFHMATTVLVIRWQIPGSPRW